MIKEKWTIDVSLPNKRNNINDVTQMLCAISPRQQIMNILTKMITNK